MNASGLVDEVIVTAITPYGESDLVVRLFGRALGRVGAFAASARRSKKRFAGGLAPLAQGSVRLTPRRGSELFRLEEAELLADPDGLGRDVVAFGRAAYLVELLERLIPEAEPAPEVFEALREALGLLAAGGQDARLLRSFELKLLGWTGYLPDLSPLDDGPAVGFDPLRAELVTVVAGAAVAFDEGAREAALRLLEAPLADLPPVEGDTLRVVGRLFAAHLRRLEIGPLQSVAFLKGLGPPRF